MIYFSSYVLVTCVSAIQKATFHYIEIDVILDFQSEEHVKYIKVEYL